MAMVEQAGNRTARDNSSCAVGAWLGRVQSVPDGEAGGREGGRGQAPGSCNTYIWKKYV